MDLGEGVLDVGLGLGLVARAVAAGEGLAERIDGGDGAAEAVLARLVAADDLAREDAGVVGDGEAQVVDGLTQGVGLGVVSRVVADAEARS